MPIEEIVVTARRGTARDIAGARANNEYFDTFQRDVEFMDEVERARDAAIEQFQSQQAFVAPVLPQVLTDIIAAVPEVIPEVIATAPRPVAGAGLAGGLLTGAALFAAEIFRELSQQRLEESYQAFSNVQPRQPDSPVATIQPEVIPEIVVTAQRPTLFAPWQWPLGFSFLSPDADPFEMQPIYPRFFPDDPIFPELAPQIDVEIPQPRPATVQPFAIPDPQIFPQLQPEIGDAPGFFEQPLAQPLQDPAPLLDPDPFIQPFAPPPPPAPLTPVNPIGVQFPSALIFDDPLAQPFAQTDPRMDPRTGKCKPCTKVKEKKKKEKPRTKCFKQLVKQARYKKDDKIFNWVPIDCRTGREL